jgi:hypothetical protein
VPGFPTHLLFVFQGIHPQGRQPGSALLVRNLATFDDDEEDDDFIIDETGAEGMLDRFLEQNSEDNNDDEEDEN